MNMTEGAIISLKAASAGRIRNTACIRPINSEVTPMGTTSKTHQVPAKRNMARAPLPSVVSLKKFAARVHGIGPGG